MEVFESLKAECDVPFEVIEGGMDEGYAAYETKKTKKTKKSKEIVKLLKDERAREGGRGKEERGKRKEEKEHTTGEVRKVGVGYRFWEGEEFASFCKGP